MQQVMLNLALNARDAMPSGGRILFRTSIVERRERVTRAGETTPAGQYVCVCVEDTGCGIAENDLDRIFEPFFTTKEHGRGTGMGLAMVYGIVRNHSGFIEVDSDEGRGSAFKVFLPCDSEAKPEQKPVPTRALPRGSGRVLVVDDEEVVRNVAARMLRNLGYSVETASCGVEAIETYSADGREFDLVILDMIMPEMGGWDCFRDLRRLNPDVRAVLSTGHGMDGMAQRILDEGMLGFVQKPYRASDLARVVASVLGPGGHDDAAPRASSKVPA
jgi:CheY-like chemotaxis protein